MLAKFKCLGCGYEYEDKPGPTTCPQCKHIWIKWLNYEEMERLIFREERKLEINKGRKVL